METAPESKPLPVLSEEQAKEIVRKMPDLLRQEFAKIPETPEKIEAVATQDDAVRALGIGIGVALAVATLTKWVPGKLKWLTGIAAAGSGLAAMRLGSDAADQTLSALKYVLPELRASMIGFADALEGSADMQKQLAGYLRDNVTPEEVASMPLHSACLKETFDFAQQTPHFNREALREQVFAHLKQESFGRGAA